MRELIEIDSPAEHACGQPTIQRWEVLEPIAGRWSWVTVFHCCDKVAVESAADEEKKRVRRAA
jgi:hypothetical protein